MNRSTLKLQRLIPPDSGRIHGRRRYKAPFLQNIVGVVGFVVWGKPLHGKGGRFFFLEKSRVLYAPVFSEFFQLKNDAMMEFGRSLSWILFVTWSRSFRNVHFLVHLRSGDRLIPKQFH